MSGPQAFLNDAAIGPEDQWLDVVIRFRIDDEVFELVRSDPVRGTAETTYIVRRGVDDTTATSHSDGAEIEWLGWTGPIPRPEPRSGLSRLNKRIAKMRRPGGQRGYVG